MRIDLHTHSRVSDGTDSPGELVALAAERGLDVVALCDHDTTAGWAEAIGAGDRLGVSVVPGVEVSTEWRGADVHLLALWADGDDAAFQQMLAGIRRGRVERIPRILEALAEHGVVLTEDDVRRAAPAATALGRPHVADALVAAGVVTSRDEAFRQWLADGRPGHVRKPAPDLAFALERVRVAGGVGVLAHPWGRGSRAVLAEPDLTALADLGLAGLEVEHVDHDEPTRLALRALAERLGLVPTGGSDYHGTGKEGVGLGENTTSEESFARLLEARDMAREGAREGARDGDRDGARVGARRQAQANG